LVDWALDRAHTASFTVVEVKTEQFSGLCVDQDARVGTKEPTLHAVDTSSFAKDRAESPPAPGLVLDRIAGLEDHPTDGNVTPSF
jgi:hypothetical protein